MFTSTASKVVNRARNIDAIVAGIENKHVDNLQVEDIQDMIEQKLMSEHKYALAKKYIIYRYTRNGTSCEYDR